MHIREEHSQREGVSETNTRGLGERAAQGPIKAMNSRTRGLPVVRKQKFIETPLRFFPRSTRVAELCARIYLVSLRFRPSPQTDSCGIINSPFISSVFFPLNRMPLDNESPYFQSPFPTRSKKQVLSPTSFRDSPVRIKNYTIFSSLGDRKEAISCSIGKCCL